MDYKLIEQQLDELNLDGYKHIKNNEWNYPEDLADYLMEKNFKRCGKGHFSEVWGSITENFVIKINMGKYYDENYLKFIEYCHKNKNNPYLPKMGKIKKLNTYDGKNFYIIFIEKLEKLGSYDLGFKSSYDYNMFMTDVCSFIYKRNISIKDVVDDFCDHYKIENKKNIMEIVKIYLDMIQEVGLDNMDMEIKNVMRRNDIPVITDPVF